MTQEPASAQTIKEICIRKIQKGIGGIRITKPRAEAEILRSLRYQGQLHPVVVGKLDKHSYEMIDGFKRLRCMEKLKQGTIKAIVITGSKRVMKAAMYQLNRGEGKLGQLEEGLLVQSLYREDKMNQKEISVLLGKHKSWVSRRMGMVEKLHESVINHFRLGLIGVSVGRELIQLPRGNQRKVLECVLKHRMTSRETTALVHKLLSEPRWNHATILSLPLEILDKREPSRPPKKERMIQSLTAEISKIAGEISEIKTRMDSCSTDEVQLLQHGEIKVLLESIKKRTQTINLQIEKW